MIKKYCFYAIGILLVAISIIFIPIYIYLGMILLTLVEVFSQSIFEKLFIIFLALAFILIPISIFNKGVLCIRKSKLYI